MSDENKPSDTNNIKGDEVIEKDGVLRSVYLHTAEDVLDKLEAISPTMCLAKWMNVSMHLPTGRTHSCYHPRTHKIPLEELKRSAKALHNTEYKKEQRKLMLQGKRPSECDFCWNIEDSGNQLSDRAYRSADVYSDENMNKVLRAGYDKDINASYVEVNFNQACNFRCAYCSPHLSTAWHKEVKDHGGYQLVDRKHNDPIWLEKSEMMPIGMTEDNPYVAAFWEYWPEMYKDIKTFRMTGGEPLMDKNTFKVFDYVIDNPRPDMQLSITSNCHPPGNQWSKFIEKVGVITKNHGVDHFMLFCSLDNWGKRAEYIRDGLDFESLYANVTEYLVKTERHSLSFIVTFNLLSVTGWEEYLRNIHRMRQEFNTDRQLIWFDTPMLTDPLWLSLQILPESYHKYMEDALVFMQQNMETNANRFKGFKDFEVSRMQRLIDWMKTPISAEQVKLGRANFYAFFTEYQRRKGLDFHSTFPEMIDFWELCEEAHNTYGK